MAIVNRDLDVSQQRTEVNENLGSLATGVTRHVCLISAPAILETVRVSAQGVSNAMQLAFEVIRGAGSSGIPIGISNLVLQNRSVSGVVSFSGLAASGSTLLSLAAGDVIQIVSSVTNGNATDLALSIVLRKSQDIISQWGN